MNKALLTLAALTMSSTMALTGALAGTPPSVIGPISGVEMPISQIDFAALSAEQLAELIAQMQAMSAEQRAEAQAMVQAHMQEMTPEARAEMQAQMQSLMQDGTMGGGGMDGGTMGGGGMGGGTMGGGGGMGGKGGN